MGAERRGMPPQTWFIFFDRVKSLVNLNGVLLVWAMGQKNKNPSTPQMRTCSVHTIQSSGVPILAAKVHHAPVALLRIPQQHLRNLQFQVL